MGENQVNPVLSTSFEAPATQFLIGNVAIDSSSLFNAHYKHI